MPNIREILTDWQTPAGSSFRTVMYFSDVPTIATQRTALGAFWTSTDGARTNQVRWTIETTGRLLDDATGVLQGVWTEPTVRTALGTVAGECVADATQVLMQWGTSSIVNGRFLRGRTYIPGLSIAQIVGGNTSTILRNTWNAAAATLISSGQGLMVWHRPVNGAGGQRAVVATGNTAVELAVLRGRRN